MNSEFDPATLWEHIADAIPDAPAIVHGELRRSWADFDDRAARLATVFADAGLGAGAKVGQLLYNTPEFIESYFAALKMRAVPFNVNHRYTAAEIGYLLDDAGTDALVYDGRVADQVAGALASLARMPLLLHVGDGKLVAGARRYEDAIAEAQPAPRIARSPDDVTMIYTGGTTGMPKGVVQKVGPALSFLLDATSGLLGQPPVSTYDDVAAMAQRFHTDGPRHAGLPAPPLMHNTGMAVGTMPVLAVGGTVVLLTEQSFDADDLWDTVERERVEVITVVGDAFARPMLRALDEHPGRDLASVRFINSSGAMFSAEVKAGLLQHLPQLTIIDIIGASEGVMGMSISTRDQPAATGSFFPVPGVLVLDEDGEPIEAGSGRAGLVALPGGAEGYHNDEAKSAVTFRRINGQPYTVPGDFAVIEADGMMTLLGRGSSCINTAGEKVFPEEVEEVLKTHPAVEDALVFGVPDDRFGQRVAAVLSYAPGQHVPTDEIVASARECLAGYKLPRSVRVVDRVPRTDVGKPDYDTARCLFAEAEATNRADRPA